MLIRNDVRRPVVFKSEPERSMEEVRFFSVCVVKQNVVIGPFNAVIKLVANW